MARYTITPWKDPSDLLTVRRQLYRLNNSPDQLDLRRHAVDRIMAWKLRSNLPHAVESTALLIDAQLHHQNATSATSTTNNPNQFNPGPPIISEFSIRAVYAAAFTRFVTGFCDIGRAKERGLEQSSMLSIAKQIGMPPEFVSLRHEATHEELPGLRRLIAAVERALEWLWNVYWSRLEEPVVESVLGEEVRGQVVRVLKAFRRERRDALRKGRKGGKEDAELIKRTKDECLTLCPSKRTAAKIIADVLVEERLLLPTNRTLGEAMDGAYMIWDELLRRLSVRLPALLGTLIEALFTSTTTATDHRPQNDTDKEAHSLWLIHLTQTIASDEIDKVMQRCCLHPGHWTQVIGRRLLDAGDDALRESWEDILGASLLGAKGVATSSSEMPPLQNMEMDEMEVDGAVQPEGKWRRALIPPTLPIGVVR